MQLFVNDLTVIDFSYLCDKRGVVGESWIVDVTLAGDLNDQSMVLDFSIVKKQIKYIIDEAVDHKLLLPMQSERIQVSQSNNEHHLFVDFQSDRGALYLQSPSCAFAQLPTPSISIESVVKHLENVILAQLPTNVKGITIGLRAEAIDGFYYHYTHGLKKHDGNCQRIAHGHRSKISIYENQIRNIALEKLWSQRWYDIYIATDSDEITKQQIQLSANAMALVTEQHRFFSYHAPQGRFDIAVDTNQLEIIDCDSTVELIADYIARQLKAEKPTSAIKVVAYEGVGKGAIADVE